MQKKRKKVVTPVKSVKSNDFLNLIILIARNCKILSICINNIDKVTKNIDNFKNVINNVKKIEDNYEL
jgi:hypothetical protein